MDRTLPDATTPGQSWPGSNDNEGVLHIPQNSKARASPSDGLMSCPGHSWVLPLCRNEIGVFYSSSCCIAVIQI